MNKQSAAPVFDRLDQASKERTRQTIVDFLQTLVDLDISIYGDASRGTRDAIRAQGYTLRGHRVCRPARHIS